MKLKTRIIFDSIMRLITMAYRIEACVLVTLKLWTLYTASSPEFVESIIYILSITIIITTVIMFIFMAIDIATGFDGWY